MPNACIGSPQDGVAAGDTRVTGALTKRLRWGRIWSRMSVSASALILIVDDHRDTREMYAYALLDAVPGDRGRRRL